MTTDWIGKPRVESAQRRLRELNPHVEIEIVAENISETNVESLVSRCDLVVAAAPLFAERLLMNCEAVRQRKPLIDCAMYDLEGRITTVIPEQTACLACLYPEPPANWKRQFPVFSAVSSTVGSLAAMEAIKLIAGIGQPLAGRLLTFDLPRRTFARSPLPAAPTALSAVTSAGCAPAHAKNSMRITAINLLLLVSWNPIGGGPDWPQYRRDAERSSHTEEKLPAELSLAWTYRPAHAPIPAWPRDDRMLFDRAHDVVIGSGVLLFGTSADDRVVALDPATGRERWSFYCDAPVRFAPAIYKDRAYVVSDDGCLYCLSLADGSLLNQWRGASGDGMILGNGRMVSRWPARGGPVIRDGIVYFGAGIWQSDGIFLSAIDAESGLELWRNDEAGKIYMPQPHGGANAESGVSAQGYFVATDKELIVPTGRAVPAVFWRDAGRFRYYHLQANGHVGGTLTVAAGQDFITAARHSSSKTGRGRQAWSGRRCQVEGRDRPWRQECTAGNDGRAKDRP
jgi:hypothetical protein